MDYQRFTKHEGGISSYGWPGFRDKQCASQTSPKSRPMRRGGHDGRCDAVGAVWHALELTVDSALTLLNVKWACSPSRKAAIDHVRCFYRALQRDIPVNHTAWPSLGTRNIDGAETDNYIVVISKIAHDLLVVGCT